MSDFVQNVENAVESAVSDVVAAVETVADDVSTVVTTEEAKAELVLQDVEAMFAAGEVDVRAAVANAFAWLQQEYTKVDVTVSETVAKIQADAVTKKLELDTKLTEWKKAIATKLGLA